VFGTFRMIGLVAITVTGVVYHVALARLLTLAGLHQLANQLVHTVVPVLTVLGWLLAGPRGQTRARAAWLAPAFPLAWPRARPRSIAGRGGPGQRRCPGRLGSGLNAKGAVHPPRRP
jgi:hypothetical protein